MTTLIVNIPDSEDARKIVDALKLMEGVTGIKVEEKKQDFEEACQDCNAISLDAFSEKLRLHISEKYRNAKS